MGGKAAMLLVLGFSLIFIVSGHNFNGLSTNSIENLENYFSTNMAHNIAVAGANMAANRIFIDKTWDKGYKDLEFQGGIINVYITNPSGTSTKVKICHKPGTPAEHTLTVAASAIFGHLSHGDYLGECGTPTPSNMVLIYAEGIYPKPDNESPFSKPDTASVYVELQPSNFAKYGNFYETMGAMPATLDTFNGRFHVNSRLKTWGNPVFWGKVTSKGGLKMYGTKNPEFHGGYESGVDQPRPFDTTGMRTAGTNGGYVFKDTTGSGNKIDVNISFQSNGKVQYQFKIADGKNKWSTKKTVPLSSLTSNGMIYVEKGNVYVEGTLKGKATIVATKKGKSGCGNIYQTDDLKYNTNPLKKNSKDMLGLVAEQNIRLQYNNKTKHNDIITQASMFAFNGNIGPDNALVKNDGKLASWKILGGLIAYNTRVTAYYNSLGPYKGYRFVHKYDKRFDLSVPPFFPHTKHYEIVSWYE